MVNSGIVLTISIPLLARENYALWVGAHVLYFIGVGLMVIQYLKEKYV